MNKSKFLKIVISTAIISLSVLVLSFVTVFALIELEARKEASPAMMPY